MRNIQSTNTEYRQALKVNYALNYIWHNFHQDVSLYNVSQLCNTSKYHFHRMFLEYQGETLNRYVLRKRMERAANLLVLYPNKSISEISSTLKFSSQANFSKLFKRYFGVTANQWKNPAHIDSISNCVLSDDYGLNVHPFEHHSKYTFLSETEKSKRLFELDSLISEVTLDEQLLIYQTIHDTRNIDSRNRIWKDVVSCAINSMSEWESSLYGIWFDSMQLCPEFLIRQDAAIKVNNDFDAPKPFMKHWMPKGRYLTGLLIGSESDLINASRDIYMFWFAHRPFTPEFHPYYLNYFNDAYEDGYFKAQFYIKIKD